MLLPGWGGPGFGGPGFFDGGWGGPGFGPGFGGDDVSVTLMISITLCSMHDGNML